MGPAASCIRAPAPEGPRSKGSAPSSASKAIEKKLNEVSAVVAKAVPLAVSAVNDVATKAFVQAGLLSPEDKPTMGSAVATPFGVGVLDRFRDDGFAVVRLDFGAKAFINPALVRKAPVPGVGEKCSTVYGDGTIVEIREADKFVVVQLNFGAKAFLRRDQVRPQRAYPFVPASHWTSGIYRTVVAPVAVTKPAEPVAKGSQSPAKSVPAVVAAEAPAAASPAKATPAHPAEEKDASEVPPPAEAEPPVAASGDAAEESEAASGAAGASASSKKKKKKNKH